MPKSENHSLQIIMPGKAWLLVYPIFLVAESISISFLAVLVFHIGVSLDEFRCPVLCVVFEVWEASPTMLELMTAIYIPQGILGHLH